jgi:hypothetical protein
MTSKSEIRDAIKTLMNQNTRWLSQPHIIKMIRETIDDLSKGVRESPCRHCSVAILFRDILPQHAWILCETIECYLHNKGICCSADLKYNRAEYDENHKEDWMPESCQTVDVTIEFNAFPHP